MTKLAMLIVALWPELSLKPLHGTAHARRHHSVPALATATLTLFSGLAFVWHLTILRLQMLLLIILCSAPQR